MAIIIIGGGMSGATLALAISYLTKGKVEIDLVESKNPDIGYLTKKNDTKVVVLTQKSCKILTSFGIWPALAPYTTKITKVEVIDLKCIGQIKINANEYQIPALGYVISVYDIIKQLFKLLHEAPGVKVHCPAMLIHVVQQQTKNIITLNNKKKIDAKLMVAADGSYSFLATKCGINWQQKNYKQTAVIAKIKTTLFFNEKAFECFTSKGLLVLLPIKNNYSALIWCLSDVYLTKISNLNEQQFCQILQLEFGWQLGRVIEASDREYYPLYLRIADKVISHRLVLIGNAAQTLHPIAAQGFNLGLRDVITLAKNIRYSMDHKKDIGDYAMLLKYQKRRQLDQKNIIDITENLVYLFNSNNLPLIIIRNIGILFVKNIPLLRYFLIQKLL